jgi:hypothetical protein
MSENAAVRNDSGPQGVWCGRQTAMTQREPEGYFMQQDFRKISLDRN